MISLDKISLHQLGNAVGVCFLHKFVLRGIVHDILVANRFRLYSDACVLTQMQTSPQVVVAR